MKKVPRGFNDLVHAKAQEAALLVRHSVVPLFSADEQSEPEFQATGTLVQLADRRFVVSAAHVFDCLHGGVHLLVQGRAREALERPIYASVAGPGRGRNRDMLDLGFCELTSDEAASIGEENFVQIADASPVPHRHWAHRCLLVGYPEKSQVRVAELSEYRLEQTLFTAPEIGESVYRRSRLDRARHVGVEFDRRKIAGPAGKGGKPMFHGMSGCGIWLLNPYETPTAGDQVTLLGFLAGPPPANGKVMFGARVETLHKFIAAADVHEQPRPAPTAG